MANFLVTTADDVVSDSDGVLSLREAITASNDASSTDDTITFASSLQGGTLVLTQGELVATDSLTIDGGTGVTISGNDASRVLRLANYANGTLDSITVTDGNGVGYGSTSGRGGGIFVGNRSDLTLIDSTITGNTAASNGGGVFLRGTLTLTDSTISDNSAGSLGGGAYAYVVNATRSTISGNSAYSGGGIFAAAAATVADSTIYDNTATGGDRAEGGGIFVYLRPSFSGESGLRLLNSTVVGNEADYRGGGVKVRNSGGGYFANSIVTGNSVAATDQGRDADVSIRTGVIFSPISSNDHNLFGSDVSGLNADDENVPVSLIFGSPTLANNGGPTKTLALREAADNPAQFGADPDDASATDQRGVARPAPAGTDPDIGAFESSFPAPASLTVAAANADRAEGDAGTTAFTFTVTRSIATDTVVSANWAVTDGTADAADFGGSLPTGVVTLQAGDLEETITVNVQGDTTVEIDETFQLVLSGPSTNATLATATATGTIRNDDQFAMLTVAPALVAVDEGDSGSTPFTFTVTRSGDIQRAASADWLVDTVNYPSNPADAADFVGGVLPSGKVEFAAGETSKDITVNVTGDLAIELTENFDLVLQNPSTGATIETARANGRIGADDFAPTATLRLVDSQDKNEGDSGTTDFTFTVRRDGDTTGMGSAHWAVTGFADTASGFDAANAADFVGGVLPSGTVTFAAGEALKTITIPVQGDTSYEQNEAFVLTLSDPSKGTAIDGSGNTTLGYIRADDLQRATISIEAVDAQKVEGTGFDFTEFVFKVTRTGFLNTEASATYTITGDFDGNDFVRTSGTAFLLANETERQLKVLVVQDSDVEPDESFTVTLSNPGDLTDIGTATATGTILNDDLALPALAISALDADKDEGNDGTTDFTFQVTRTGDTTGVTSAQWAVSGAAVDRFDFADFTLPSGTVSFAAGEETQTITVGVRGEIEDEDDESFQVALSDPTGATVATGTAEGTIRDDEVSILNIGGGNYSVAEGDSGTTELSFSVFRDGATSDAVSFDWAVSGDADGADFVGGTLPSGSFTFQPGEFFGSITVEIQGDTEIEPDESLTLTLSNPSAGAVLGRFATATGTIEADDFDTPVLSVAATDAERDEGNSGTTALTFTVTRVGVTSVAASAAWAVSGGSVDATDFVGDALPSGRVEFAAGETEQTITVEVQGDTEIEDFEDFELTLSDPSDGAQIRTASAFGGIYNDDVATDLLSAVAQDAFKFEGDSGTTSLTFSVTRSGEASVDASVDWAIDGDVDGGDFVGGVLPSGTVSFAPNQNIRTVTVEVQGDTDVEADEPLRLTLTNPSDGAQIDIATATGTVRNDDVEIIGTSGNEKLVGTDADDVIRGLAGYDTLWGQEGDDQLFGGKGNDLLFGKAGIDQLTGGLGADRFVLRAVGEAPPGGPDYEEILDFNRSQGDMIDLRTIDANEEVAGNQAFRFGGSGVGRIQVEAFGGDFLVSGSTEGDAAAEFAFVVRTGLSGLKASDFLL